jgi:hypothetical protein
MQQLLRRTLQPHNHMHRKRPYREPYYDRHDSRIEMLEGILVFFWRLIKTIVLSVVKGMVILYQKTIRYLK